MKDEVEELILEPMQSYGTVFDGFDLRNLFSGKIHDLRFCIL